MRLYSEANEMLVDVLPLARRLNHPYGETWNLLALCLVARDECETALFGKLVSPPVTSELIAAARTEWEPVAERLRTAEFRARESDFAAAAADFRRGMAHSNFHLDLALQEIEWFPLKVCTALLMTGAQEECFEFCRRFFGEIPIPVGSAFVGLLNSFPDNLPADLSGLLRDYDVANPSSTEWQRIVGDPDADPDFWLVRDHGRALYRQERFEEAVAPLELAAKADNQWVAFGARAALALTLHRLGRSGESRDLINEVDAEYQQILKIADGRLDPYWHEQAMLELTLRKGRRLIRGE